jgi:hypothetical protein
VIPKEDNECECINDEQIPDEAREQLRPEVAKLLGQPISIMFHAFQKAFPLTVAAIENNWPIPRLYCQRIKSIMPSPHDGKMRTYFASVREDLNLFFALVQDFAEIEGANFDRYNKMLPPKWVELYRWFDSFVITDMHVQKMQYTNTPFRYSARLRVNDFCIYAKIKKQKGLGWAKKNKFDVEKLSCWLWTDGGDSLWLDEARSDHKVYHMRNNSFDDVILLTDADTKLDRYMAHVVSGGDPKDFSFRD